MPGPSNTSYLPLTTQTVSYDASASTATKVSPQIRIVRIVATTNVNYAVAVNPTATTSDAFLPAETVEYISIRPGQKIAFIKASGSTAGTAYVTEVTM